MVQILYEDNHLIAVAKPHGVLVQGDDTGDRTILDEVKEYLKEKYKKPGNVFLGVIHRLDRPVAGILLLAKTSKGASRLSEQFRIHKTEKIYHALVEGAPKEESATLTHFLQKDTDKNIVSASNTPIDDAKEARLSYMVYKTLGNRSILKVTLHTGRSHQIRAQLSAIGCPIVGDSKYGAKIPYVPGAIALVATGLSFETATTGERIQLHIDIPNTWI